MRSRILSLIIALVCTVSLSMVAPTPAHAKRGKNKNRHAKNRIPRGARGFSGMVKGEVVGKVKNGFILKIRRIVKTWEGNKARNPESLKGKKIIVNARWIKNRAGKWVPYKLHLKFIKRLEKGADIEIEIANREAQTVHILELSKEQRDFAKGKKEDEKKGLPRALKGFSGKLRGEVVDDDKNGFYFRVGKILKKWKNNKADEPEKAVGKIVRIKTGWKKNKKGKWRPIEMHVKFIKKLKTGMEISIAVRHYKDDKLNISELTKEQRKIAKGEAEPEEPEIEVKPSIPDGLKGFKGMLRGIVTGKAKNGFLLKVSIVVGEWKGSKAKESESVVGKIVLISAQWRKGKDGKSNPDETHLHFIRKVKKDHDVIIDVVNDEGERLHIFELTKEQLR